MHINRFLTHIDGMARANRFEVDIFVPGIGLRMRGIRCQKATLPGKTLELSTFRQIPGGAPNHLIKGVKYDETVILGFMLDSTYEDRANIELWQNYIYNDDYSIKYPKVSTGAASLSADSTAEKGSQSYVGTVVIRQLGGDGFTLYEVQLEDAFPTVLGSISLDMSTASVSTFDVTFSYRTWHSAYANTPTGSYLANIFNKHKRRIGTRIKRKLADKVFG